ncbi:hypothetical protein KI387_037639, partial [Taxus chinensis]
QFEMQRIWVVWHHGVNRLNINLVIGWREWKSPQVLGLKLGEAFDKVLAEQVRVRVNGSHGEANETSWVSLVGEMGGL